MNERYKLLRKLSAAQFAAWELHLYLDTHPCDEAAISLFKKYSEEEASLKKEFEQKYGTLKISAENSEEWLNNPWPWDITGGNC